MTCKNILLPFQSSTQLDINGKETDEVDVMTKILPIRSGQYGLKFMPMVLYDSITNNEKDIRIKTLFYFFHSIGNIVEHILKEKI